MLAAAADVSDVLQAPLAAGGSLRSCKRTEAAWACWAPSVLAQALDSRVCRHICLLVSLDCLIISLAGVTFCH